MTHTSRRFLRQPTLPGLIPDASLQSYLWKTLPSTGFSLEIDREIREAITDQIKNMAFSTNYNWLGKVLLQQDTLEEHEERIEEHENKIELLASLMRKAMRYKELMVPDYEEQEEPFSTQQKKLNMIEEAKKYIVGISRNFEDIEKRLILVIRLKEIARGICEIARDSGDKYLKQVAMMLHDSIKQVYAEQLTREKLVAVENILEILEKEVIDLNDAKVVHNILISKGLEYMPEIKELQVADK